MINNDSMLAKNSGTPPDRLLFDKSLVFDEDKKVKKQSNRFKKKNIL